MTSKKLDKSNNFLIGVNYWPRKKAMYWWKNFDEEEVKKEFGEIKQLNLQVVRIFLDWEEFQPKPGKIDSNALKNFETVLDIAEGYKFKVIPTFFCGYMSGMSVLPEWAVDKRGKFYIHPTLVNGKLTNYPIKNLFEDEGMLKAQCFQVKTIASEFSEHPAIHAWDLNNEVEILTMPRNHEVAKGWIQRLVKEIRKVDAYHPIICGFSQENLEAEVITNWISDASQYLDFLCMHGYPDFSKITTNPTDPYYVPFCNILTQSLGKKPVLFEEFGLPTAPPGKNSLYIEAKGSTSGSIRPYLANEEEAAEYYENVLEGLHRCGSLGALAWCFSDYEEGLWGMPPFDKCVHERFFGITRSDGSVKPMGKVLSKFVGRMVLPAPTLFELLPDKYYKDPIPNFKILWSSFKKELSNER